MAITQLINVAMAKTKLEYVTAYIDKQTKIELEKLSKKNCRTVSQQIAYLIKKAIYEDQNLGQYQYDDDDDDLEDE